MMHGKYLILLLALLTNSMTLRAEKLTAEQALQRLQGSKYSKGVGTQRVSPLSLSYTHKSKNTNIFYAFNDTVNGGYVLLSADDTVPALLAEVSTGTFAIDNMPDNARRWLEKTSHDIELATTLSLPLFSSVTKSGNRQDVAPMITATWGQREPYNNMCPACDNGAKSVSGCVATAMAMIMYYHKWPTQGTGSYSYTSKSNRFNLSADFGSTTYRWDFMQDHYGNTSLDGAANSTNFDYDASSADAVATLMYQCGVSVNMDYDNRGSGTITNYVPAALINHFSYDKGMSLQCKIWYNDEEWDEKVYQELASGRPLLYSGTSISGGHAFICDGYRDGYFHFNWGWDGMANGYYLITGVDAMHPRVQDTGASASDAYTMDNDALFGMQKPSTNIEAPLTMGVPKDTHVRIFSMSGQEVSHLEKEETAQFIFDGSYFYNYSNRTISVYHGAKFVDVNTGKEYITTTNFKKTYKTGSGSSKIDIFVTGIPDGKYKAYPIFGEDKGNMIEIRLPYNSQVPEITIGNYDDPNPDPNPDPDPDPDPNPDPEPNPNPGEGDTDISQYPNVIYFSPAVESKGSDFTLKVKMKNEAEITSFQFDVLLPEGLSFVKDEYDNAVITLDESRSSTRRHVISTRLQEDGKMRIICYSPQNSVFTGHDGAVLNISLTASTDMPTGKQHIEFHNMHLATVALDDYYIPLVKTTIEINEGALGDVDGDGDINVVDVTALVNLVVGSGDTSNYKRNAADINGDGIINVVDVTALINIILSNR